MCYSTTLQNLNVHILSFSTTAVTNILHRHLKFFLLKTNKHYVGYHGYLSVVFTVTDDGF